MIYNFTLIKETEKAVNVTILLMTGSVTCWVPKSVSKIVNTEIEIADWFAKKEIEANTKSVRNWLNGLKHEGA